MDIAWGDVLELLGTVTGGKVTAVTVMEVDPPRSRRASVRKSPELQLRVSPSDGRWAMGIGECLIGFGLGVDGHFGIIPFLKGRLFILNRRGKTKKIFV